MSIFGKPPARQPNKPFQLSQQNGEQIDAVRSKIASLMDSATEKQAPSAPQTAAPEEAATRPSTAEHPTPQQANQPEQSRTYGEDEWSDGERWPRRTDWGADTSNENGQPRRAAPATNPERPLPWPDASTDQANRPTGLPAVGNSAANTTATPNTYSDPSDASSWSSPPERSFITAEESPLNHPRVNHAHESLPDGRAHTEDPNSANGYRATAEPSASEMSSATAPIHIKGRAGGILIEIGNGPWAQLMVALTERLVGAGNFFRNGAVTLELAARPLTESELHQLHKLLTEQSLTLALVRTASEATFQVALDMGLSAQLESLTGEPAISAQPAQSNLGNEPHFVYAGHLRAGQVLQRSEHILVIGDVNPGATVISNGDILVWGHLRGLAHAGAGGDNRAVIAALNLAAVQLRICDYVAIAPEPAPKRRWGRKVEAVKQAEVAYIHGERIVVEPWDGTKFGGIAALRQ